MKKQHIILIVIGIAIIIVSWWAFPGDKNRQEEILIQPTVGKFQVTVTVTGELQPKKSTKIRGPSELETFHHFWGIKLAALIPEGTVVKKGDFVAELDYAKLDKAIEEEKTELQKAEADFARSKLDTAVTLSGARENILKQEQTVATKHLEKEQSIYEAPATQQQAEMAYQQAIRAYEQEKKKYTLEKDKAKASVENARDALKRRRETLEKYNAVRKDFRILAPADGMLIYAKERWGNRKIVVGSEINLRDPIVATLPDFSIMESITYVNELDIHKVALKQPVEIRLDAAPDKKLTGEVSKIANIGEQLSNSVSKVFKVNILIQQSDTTLRPAMTTNNTIITTELDSVLYIPLECLQTEDSLNFVFRKHSLTGPQKQEVKIGLVNDSHVIILKGISPEDPLYMSRPEKAKELPLHHLSTLDQTDKQKNEH